jgi:hypothetical protein
LCDCCVVLSDADGAWQTRKGRGYSHGFAVLGTWCCIFSCWVAAAHLQRRRSCLKP